MFPTVTSLRHSRHRRRSIPGRRATLVALAIAALAMAISCGTEGTSGSGAVVDSVAIDPDTLLLRVGNEGRLGVTVLDVAGTTIRGRTVFWSSADTTIATVDQDGLVTARRTGVVRVSANVEGHSALATVIVQTGSPASVSVDPATATVLVGSTTTLAATVRDAFGNVLTDRAPVWSTSNAGIATVNQSGVVTGVSPGTVTISATREGKTGSATVTVLRIPVARVVVSPANPTVKVGSTTQLTATLYDAQNRLLTGRTVTWTSSNTAIATVDANGKVTGKKVGTATITATSEGQSGSVTLTVRSS